MEGALARRQALQRKPQLHARLGLAELHGADVDALLIFERSFGCLCHGRRGEPCHHQEQTGKR
jgi:hypothetical protein